MPPAAGPVLACALTFLHLLRIKRSNHPRGRTLRAGGQTRDDRLVGTDDQRILRRHRDRHRGLAQLGRGTKEAQAPWVAWSRARSCGIVDEQGRDVKQGEIGEIYLRGPLLSDFTYNNDDAKRREIALGDLVTVGDVGYQDPDGYLFLCDRKRDMIISGGVNIYPAEIVGADPDAGRSRLRGDSRRGIRRADLRPCRAVGRCVD